MLFSAGLALCTTFRVVQPTGATAWPAVSSLVSTMHSHGRNVPVDVHGLLLVFATTACLYPSPSKRDLSNSSAAQQSDSCNNHSAPLLLSPTVPAVAHASCARWEASVSAFRQVIGPAVEGVERVCANPDFQRSAQAALHGGALAALRRNIALLNTVVSALCEASKVRRTAGAVRVPRTLSTGPPPSPPPAALSLSPVPSVLNSRARV